MARAVTNASLGQFRRRVGPFYILPQGPRLGARLYLDPCWTCSQPLARFIRPVYSGGAILVEMNTEHASSSNRGRLFCFLICALAFKYFAQDTASGQCSSLDRGPSFPQKLYSHHSPRREPSGVYHQHARFRDSGLASGLRVTLWPRSHPSYM